MTPATADPPTRAKSRSTKVSEPEARDSPTPDRTSPKSDRSSSVSNRPTRRSSAPGLTLADLLERFGPIPAGRVVHDPRPGTATQADWERINRRGDGQYELIDGTLIRKAVSDLSSWLGGKLFRLLGNFAEDGGLGFVHPADGYFNLPDGMRAPDASFTRFADRPDGLQEQGYSDVPPALVVEALSPGNTRREMELKRRIYFSAGVELVWEADPLARTVTVWRGPDASQELSAEDAEILTGAPVLPGFTVSLPELFTTPTA